VPSWPPWPGSSQRSAATSAWLPPDMLLRRHRALVRRHWTKLHRRPGRPSRSAELRRLIVPQVECTDTICSAASYMSTDELHERIFAPYGLATVKVTLYGSTIRRLGHLRHPQLWHGGAGVTLSSDAPRTSALSQEQPCAERPIGECGLVARWRRRGTMRSEACCRRHGSLGRRLVLVA
jgi:hypothetical protein